MFAATFFDGDDWRDGVVEVVGDRRIQLRDEVPATGLPRLDGVITGGFTDHHVHLQLVDAGLLGGSVLGRVVDLGGNVEVLAALVVHNSGSSYPKRPVDRSEAPSGPKVPELWTPPLEHPVGIEFAGAFLTAPGGYPSDRAWAPTGSFREIASAVDAAAAVGEMADAGASCIKVASNSSAGPVFDDDLYRTIIDLAAARGLPVIAHAEGRGEAQRAARLGAAQLAHTPFTERLDDAEIAAQAAGITWISTLAIHSGGDLRVAVHNLRRFHAAGGTVLYGTDLGNAHTSVGLDARELTALRDCGLDDAALLRTLAPVDPLDDESPLLLFPGATPMTADPLHARLLTPIDLKV